jgi:replicative DNA helicase
MDTRVIPHSLEAERALLGSILLSDKAWSEVASEVEARHFFRHAHQRIFEAMQRCKDRGLTIELVTLRDTLGKELEDVGGASYISSLIDGMPLAMNVRHYATILREKTLLRDLIDAGNKLVAEAYGSEEIAAAVLEDGVRSLLALSQPAMTGPVSVGQAVREYVSDLDISDANLLPTGYRDLDYQLGGGLKPKELTIIAARPSVGKSSFVFGLSKYAAFAGSPGIIFSLEMSKEASAARMLSAEARVNLSRRSSELSNADHQRMAEAWERLDTLPLLIEDSARTITQITAWCHRLQQRAEGLKFAVIDYVQLMGGGNSDKRHQEVAVIAKGLKQMAVDLGLVVIACSQLNRAPESRQDKRPHLSELKESGALEEVADIAVLLYREEMHNSTEENAGIAEAIIAKQRNGPTGVTRLAFLRQFAQFADLA